MNETSILIVDDEKNILTTIAMALESDGHLTHTADNGATALSLIDSQQFDAILLDVMLPDIDGLEILRIARDKHPNLTIIIMSGHGTISTAVQATKLGAYDFLEKPISRDKLLLSIRRAIDFRRLESENIALRSEIAQKYDIIAQSPCMKELIRRIETVGPSPSRVLITGENGVGKELVARALHQASPRASKPFIKVNCAAIPHDLIESELFGHERGSFTGAIQRRRGKFELAHKGTIFLDEIADMHLDTQAKVLRVLQENEIQRVGGEETIKVDVRVIAATNKDLDTAIRMGSFREDLYYRLNVIPIIVPPLRDRTEDISYLSRHFFNVFTEEYGRTKKILTDDAIATLTHYHWPGNVRELKNIIERIFIMSPSETIDRSAVTSFLPHKSPLSPSQPTPIDLPLKEATLNFEKDFIEQKLKEYNYRISETARSLQIERSHLYKKIKALDIKLP